MIRENRFLISHRPYAVDLATLTGHQHERGDRIAFSGSVNALWFRRKSGITQACIGPLGLWSHYLTQRLNLDEPHDVLSANLDGRYGGNCLGRWDGSSYWGNVPLTVQQKHLSVLEPMLDNYPAVPDGFDGWWRFVDGYRSAADYIDPEVES